jgi:hypothetical protein
MSKMVLKKLEFVLILDKSTSKLKKYCRTLFWFGKDWSFGAPVNMPFPLFPKAKFNQFGKKSVFKKDSRFALSQ